MIVSNLYYLSIFRLQRPNPCHPLFMCLFDDDNDSPSCNLGIYQEDLLQIDTICIDKCLLNLYVPVHE